MSSKNNFLKANSAIHDSILDGIDRFNDQNVNNDYSSNGNDSQNNDSFFLESHVDNIQNNEHVKHTRDSKHTDDNISTASTDSMTMLDVKNDFHLTELINSDFALSAVAQPLTPRTRFISSCIREGLNPRASLVIRRHMSTHLKLSHFAIGGRLDFCLLF